jgi:signal transduction histidine kinase/CheY-like chemotaxis protein
MRDEMRREAREFLPVDKLSNASRIGLGSDAFEAATFNMDSATAGVPSATHPRIRQKRVRETERRRRRTMSLSEVLQSEREELDWIDISSEAWVGKSNGFRNGNGHSGNGNGYAAEHLDLEPHLDLGSLAESLLDGELDYRETLAIIARNVIGRMAEACLLDVLSEEGTRLRLSVLPKSSPAAGGDTDLVYHFSSSAGFPPAVLEVLASGKPQIFGGSLSKSRLLNGDAPLPLPFGASLQSGMIVPLRARGRTLGAITFLSLSPIRKYLPYHVARAEQLARPCALALDNARRHALVATERDEARESGLAKDELLATLGHEIRNFIVPILGWARSLNRETVDLDGDCAQGARAIEANAEAIARLVEDCVEGSRSPRGQMSMARETVDLNEIGRLSVDAVRKTALAKGLSIDLRLTESELWVAGDRTRLSQVLANLLTNSIKYTEPGGAILVQSRRLDGKVELEIRDTGRGLTPGMVESLSGPVPRGGRAPSRGGLGLFLSRKIMEMHGGEIFVESAGPNRGSSFRLRLASAASPSPVSETASPASLPLHPMRVLLIDDSRDVLSLMKLDMERLGYVVSTACDGLSGLRTAISERPDAVISDIMLPDMDGLELVRRMREIPELSSIPAIALSGLSMRQDAEESLACGYHAHLAKPVDVFELSSMIQSLDTSPPR